MFGRDPSTPEELSLDQAANLLGYNVKTLRRHIKAKKLRARLQGGQYRIRRSDVWHVLYDRHDICGESCLGIQRSARLRDFKISETDHAEPWVFNEWGTPVTCEDDDLPEFEVTLGVAELRRELAEIRRPKNQRQYEALRRRMRDRIQSQHRQRPSRFVVVLRIDEVESYELCQRVFRRVKSRPIIPGVSSADLESEAIHHLMMNAMPHITHARSPVHYLSTALANLYKSKVRREGIGKKGVKKRAGYRDENVDLEASGRLADGSHLIVGHEDKEEG
jgi:excisionase family DNA binding protein